MTDVVIAAAARTPVGAFNGGLSKVPASYLGEVAIRAALERAGVAPEDVSEVVLGQIRAGCRMNVRQRRIATPVLGRGVGIDDLRRAAIGLEPVQQPPALP